jgi:tetratricopeptide (TPR) repeat protein
MLLSLNIKTIILTFIIIILFLFIGQFSVTGQTSSNQISNTQLTIDSLENILKTTNNKEKPSILNELAKNYIEIYLGIVFYNKSNYDKSLEYSMEALQILEEINEKEEIEKIYNKIGLAYKKQGNYEKAVEYYNRSLELSQEIDNIQGIAIAQNNIGTIYKNCGDYEKAIEYYNISLEISQKIDDKKGIARTQNNIGLVYYKWGKYEKAIEFFNISFEIYQEFGDKQGIASALNNMGIVYGELNNYEKAIEYYNRSLVLKQEIGDKQRIANTLHNIGNIYSSRANYKKAIEYYYNSLKISQEIGDKQGCALSQSNIGSSYLDMGNYKKAIEFYNKSLQIAQSLDLKGLIYNNFQGLSGVYSATKEYNKSLEYYKLYITIKDSVFNEKSRQQITNLEFRHETEKNENKIKLLEKNQKIQELKFDKEKKIRNTFTIAFILVSVFIFILSYLYVQKQKAYKIIVKHNIELAKKDIEFEKNRLNAVNQKEVVISNPDEIKYSDSILNETRKYKLLQDIILFMEEKKQFLNPKFTIEDCAKELHTNRKYISQVINESLEMNFNNFVNEYRVKEVRKFLINPEYNNYSLNGIASMAGFHSRATFNSAFKKITGLTPSYFKKKNNYS